MCAREPLSTLLMAFLFLRVGWSAKRRIVAWICVAAWPTKWRRYCCAQAYVWVSIYSISFIVYYHRFWRTFIRDSRCCLRRRKAKDGRRERNTRARPNRQPFTIQSFLTTAVGATDQLPLMGWIKLTAESEATESSWKVQSFESTYQRLTETNQSSLASTSRHSLVKQTHTHISFTTLGAF